MKEEEWNIGFRLKYIHEGIRKSADAAFAMYGLTGPQVGYLNLIQEAGGEMTQKALEKRAGVSHATISGVLTRLRNKGYVTIEKDGRDGRNRIIRLTEKARDATEALREGGRRMNVRLVRGLSQEDRQELDRLLGQIGRNLKEEQLERRGSDAGKEESDK